MAEKVGITLANLSIRENGKAKEIRLSALEAICQAVDYQPGDILESKGDWLSALKVPAVHLHRRIL